MSLDSPVAATVEPVGRGNLSVYFLLINCSFHYIWFYSIFRFPFRNGRGKDSMVYKRDGFHWSHRRENKVIQFRNSIIIEIFVRDKIHFLNLFTDVEDFACINLKEFAPFCFVNFVALAFRFVILCLSSSGSFCKCKIFFYNYSFKIEIKSFINSLMQFVNITTVKWR